MASTFEYMQFALGVYATESEENKIGVPSLWNQIDYEPVAEFRGQYTYH